MADDLMFGFKFHDRDDKMADDTDVMIASELMFSEDMTDHLGAKPQRAEAPAEDAGRMGDMDSFDFVESFDFAM